MRRAAAAALLAGIGVARAQPAPDSDAGRCEALARAAADTGLPFTTVPAVTASGPDSCTLGPARLDLMPRFGVEVEEVRVEGLTPGAPRTGIIRRRIELRGTRQVIPLASPAVVWMQHVVQTPLLLVLEAAEDVGARTMTASWHVSGRHYGRVDLSLSLRGVGPETGPFGLPDVSGAALTEVGLHWDSQVLMLRFAVPALAGTLREHPEEEVAEDKRQAEREMRAALAQFPGVAPGAADALAAFIQDFPRPTKVLDLSIDLTSHPVSAADAGVASGGPDAAMAMARGYTLRATYAGEAE